MRRFILIVFILIAYSSLSSAQTTYYYKHVKIIESDGSLKQGSGGKYLTFVGDVMYESDENGNLRYISFLGSIPGHYVSKYHFRTVKNGNRVYFKYVEPTAWSSGYYDEKDYYIVSNNMSVINYNFLSVLSKSNVTHVYHKANKVDEIPDIIY